MDSKLKRDLAPVVILFVLAIALAIAVAFNRLTWAWVNTIREGLSYAGDHMGVAWAFFGVILLIHTGILVWLVCREIRRRNNGQ